MQRILRNELRHDSTNYLPPFFFPPRRRFHFLVFASNNTPRLEIHRQENEST